MSSTTDLLYRTSRETVDAFADAVERLGMDFTDDGAYVWVKLEPDKRPLNGAEAQVVKMKGDRDGLSMKVVGGDNYTHASSRERRIQAGGPEAAARELEDVLRSWSRGGGGEESAENGSALSRFKRMVGLGESGGAMTGTEIRQLVRRELAGAVNEDVSGARWAILAPETADHEILRFAEGDTDKEAMNDLMDWARNNGFTVDTGTSEASSYWDYRFERGNNSLPPTKLQ